MIFALNFGLFNEFGEYLVTVGHSVAFLFPLLLKFGTAEGGIGRLTCQRGFQ